MTLSVAPPTLKASRRFLDDARRLTLPIHVKLLHAIRLVQQQGIHYPSLKARQVESNPDGRFRYLNVDDQYRMVAVVEGDHVFLEKVGNHDETLKWGTTATLREYEERLAFDPLLLARRQRRAAQPATAELFEVGPSLAEIAASGEISDLLADCVDGVLEGWRDGTIEDWMVFLSPVQRRSVDRAVGGPARVTGGPGTGKTVVGLHRAAGFARDLGPDGRVLMTSFVRTVPEVLEGLFERLAPEVCDRAEFASLHRLAGRVLHERGIELNVDEEAAKRRFHHCLESKPDRHRQLRLGARLADDYLWEEVTRVIEGRGVLEREAYLRLARHGRKRGMPALVRSLVWDLYEEYRAVCDTEEAPVVDWNRFLQVALQVVRETPALDHERYDAIVVDEAQDITEVGVRLLVELLEGGSSGRILMVGDSGQRIYPGGYRLADLGLEIRGRSFPMTVCYRSTDEIMQAAGALGQFLSTEEFGEDGLRELSMSTVRSGPRPRLLRFPSEAEEAGWVLAQLDPDDPDVDATAVLVPSNRAVGEWRARLEEGGLGSVPLDEYHGRPLPGVKVGTYNRAKGLEFKRVFLPNLGAWYPNCDRNDPDEMIERGSVLYVAMSRARDELTLTYVGVPSMFLRPVARFCELEPTSGRP